MERPVDRTTEELAAIKKFLALCIGWLPYGLLRETIRQVTQNEQDRSRRFLTPSP